MLEHAVDHDVEPGEVGRQRHPAAFAQRVAAGGVIGVALEVDHAGGVDRRGDGGHIPVGEDVDIVHAGRVQGRHRAPAGRAEADDGRPERAPVFAGDADELHGVQHRAVAGQLVVLVEDVQAE